MAYPAAKLPSVPASQASTSAASGGAPASALRMTPLRSLVRAPKKQRLELLCLDMDGTVLDSRSRVSARVAASIREVQAAGIQVVIATGKARAGAARALEGVGLSGEGGIVFKTLPGVFLQGLLVYGRDGKLAHSEQLTPDVLRVAFDVSAQSGIALCAFAGDRALSLAASPLLDKLHAVYHEPKVEARARRSLSPSVSSVFVSLFFSRAFACVFRAVWWRPQCCPCGRRSARVGGGGVGSESAPLSPLRRAAPFPGCCCRCWGRSRTCSLRSRRRSCSSTAKQRRRCARLTSHRAPRH